MHGDLPVAPACAAQAWSTRPPVRCARNAGVGREARREAPEIEQGVSVVSRIGAVTPGDSQGRSAEGGHPQGSPSE